MPQLSKEGIQGLHGHSLFVFVQQRVIGLHFRVIIARELSIIGNDFFQVRGKGFKIILQLGLMPHVLGVVQQDIVGDVLFGGDPIGLIIILPENFHFPFLQRA